MKSCLLLTGHVRSFDRCKNEILKKFTDGNTDIYCCTWNDQGVYDIQSRYKIPVKNQIILDANEHDIKPISLLDRENDIFKNDPRAVEHKEKGWIERLRLQWFCVKMGFNLIEDYEKYDVITRCRYDLKFSNNKHIEYDLEKLNIAQTKNHSIHGYNDHFAIGAPEIMKNYCTIYDNIEKMYQEHNIDISYAEKMLKFYIEDYCNIETKYHYENYIVLKMENDKTRIQQ